MLLLRSAGRKVLATSVVALVFAFLFEVTVFDSRHAGRLSLTDDIEGEARPETGKKLRFTATFY